MTRGITGLPQHLRFVKYLNEPTAHTPSITGLVHDRNTGDLAVVKCFDPTGDQEVVNRQLRILAQFHHPFLPRLKQFWVDEENNTYLSYQYLRGQNLSQAGLDMLSRTARVEFFLLLVDTVHRLHQFGIVHGQLDERHILLAEGKPAIVGFAQAVTLGEARLKHSSSLFFDGGLSSGQEPAKGAFDHDVKAIRTLINTYLLTDFPLEDHWAPPLIASHKGEVESSSLAADLIQLSELRQRMQPGEMNPVTAILQGTKQSRTKQIASTNQQYQAPWWITRSETLLRYLPQQVSDELRRLFRKFTDQRADVHPMINCDSSADVNPLVKASQQTKPSARSLSSSANLQPKSTKNRQRILKITVLMILAMGGMFWVLNIMLSSSRPETIPAGSQSAQLQGGEHAYTLGSESQSVIPQPESTGFGLDEPEQAIRVILSELLLCVNAHQVLCLQELISEGALLSELRAAVGLGEHHWLAEVASLSHEDRVIIHLVERYGDFALLELSETQAEETRSRTNIVLELSGSGWRIRSAYT